MSAPNPISGASGFFIGANSTYTSTTAGGVWSSGDVSIMTIGAGTGIATGVSQGTTQVIYTVSGDSTALNIEVSATGIISNGFNPTLVLNALKNRVLWPSQGTSDSGRYFIDFHPLCDETIMAALPNITPDYATWLSSLTNSVVLECVNAVYNKAELIDSSRLVFNRSDITLVEQPVANQNPAQFVGLKLQLAPGDYGIKLNKLTMFFDSDVTFPMYLYNDFDLPPVYQISVSARAHQQVIVSLQNNAILNYLTPDNNKGGVWYFGYFQSDLGSAKAIYYPVYQNMFHACIVWAFSAPTFTDALGQINFRRNIVGANNLTYGLNLEIATMVDATNNIVSNPSLWDELIGLKMATRVMEICKFSYQTSSVQRAVQSLGGVDALNIELNGRPGNFMVGQPKITGLIQRVNDEARKVKKSFEPDFEGGIGLL